MDKNDLLSFLKVISKDLTTKRDKTDAVRTDANHTVYFSFFSNILRVVRYTLNITSTNSSPILKRGGEQAENPKGWCMQNMGMCGKRQRALLGNQPR